MATLKLTTAPVSAEGSSCTFARSAFTTHNESLNARRNVIRQLVDPRGAPVNKAVEDASHLYDVDDRKTYAAREGFRIRELALSSTQEVPWHLHSAISDTFYVLNGDLRIELRTPDEEAHLKPGQCLEVVAGRPHRVTSAGPQPVTFLILQGIGRYDYIPVD